MSSSVFIESCAKPLTSGVGSENDVAVSGSPNSNLVVVYGKKGVNFDQRGIENLIEEKTLSSISVIRLTSPTPSMIDEEEEAERTEELLRRQAEGLSDDESNRSSNRNSSSTDECAENTGSEEVHTADDEKSDCDGENSTDNGKSECRKKTRRNRRKMRTVTKIHNIQNKLRKERPDIVGLTVEEFYPPVSAKEMVKEALKLAGVPTFKRTADYEFQLYVIKNDHCYTPFTSPAQMKAKLAEKYKAEKHAVIGRKIIPHTAITMKQLQLKKKVVPVANDFAEQSTLHSVKDQNIKVLNKIPSLPHKQGDTDGLVEGDTEAHSSTAESDIDILSEESGDTDNDRDSDLDFNVNNRKGRKKKDLVSKAKRLSAGKVCVKRLSQPQDDDDQRNKNIRPVTGNISIRSCKIGTPLKTAGCAPIAVQKLLSDAVAALPPIPKRPVTAQIEDNALNPVPRPQAMPNVIRRGPIIEVGVQKVPNVRKQLLTSPQSVKEIVINKVMASPKRGFTEIGELLAQTDKQIPTRTAPSTPTSSTKNTQLMVVPSPSKGFMPLGVETAAKNKLPAQISIQTHQSSSELAAKSNISMEAQSSGHPDTLPSNISAIQCVQKEQSSSELAAEQFDLIVSIVKGEMQKTAAVEASKSNENIPKLVKMLENAEHTLESNGPQTKMDNNLTNFGSSAETNVDDIDISNAPLLETPDDFPDDLLQHVVDLIEDDETLQEAVEKQVFGGDHNEGIPCAGSVSATSTRSVASSTVQSHTSESFGPLETNQPKSIIEMAISNIPSVSSAPSSTVSHAVRVTNIQTLKTAPPPAVRKEPIQIVRGNGRVITLPPIEAPTTRAKRRAQNQPVTAIHGVCANSSTILNESSMDGSLQSNSSITIFEHIPPATIEKKPETTNKRRVSKESGTAGTVSSKTKKSTASAKKSAAAKTIAGKSGAEEEASGSQEDDDDPNRLWCICRQPHNNRFMICCDVCEDWFHGTCVSITKAMGIDMEQRGVDWTCPKCVKLQEEKKQRKITDMLFPKVSSTEKHEQLEVDARNEETTNSSLDTSCANITASSIEKSNWMETKQTIETPKTQSEQVPPIKLSLKKGVAAAKAATSSLKKKQASNAKRKGLNTPISQTKKQIPFSQQEPKHDSTKSPLAIQPVSSLQQTQRDFQKSATTESMSTDPHTFCIVCKKMARQNSIYCSDDCIRKHAQNALNVFAAASAAAKFPEPTVASSSNEEAALKKKKAKGLFEDILSMADRKPKVERVHVIDRKSGRVLTGSNAPTTLNLKKWLQENQTFEVVQPGSSQAQEIEKKQKQRLPPLLSPVINSTVGKHIPQSPQSAQIAQITPHVTPIAKTAQSQKECEITAQMQKPAKLFIEQIVKTAPNSPRPGTPKQLQKYPQQVSIKPDKVPRSDSKEDTKERKEKSSKQRPSVETVVKKHSDTVASVSTNSEPIRLNVRRTLKEQLLQRMNESESENDSNLPKLSIEEIEKFVFETEAEMYEYFSRDTGSRYRAKYRSLMFNIKDRKNHTLFAKICTKIIQPKQLVRMSPEELASQELAKWRENEAKHQLEMIKKSELDLLSCAKNYVLKTHKGEEVIEGKLEDCVNLDVTIPVEDVVSVLNSSVVSSSSSVGERAKADMGAISLSFDHSQSDASRLDEEKQKNHSKEKDRERDRDRDCERERNREHGRDREHYHARARSHDSDHSREKQRKSKDRHRDKTRSRKRSRSHTRSRSRSREKRHKSCHKEEKREREDREREKDKFKEKERERDRDRDTRQQKDEFDSKLIDKTATSNIPLVGNSNKNNVISSGKDKSSIKPATTLKPIEAYSLVDQILESTKTVEEAANLISEKEKLKEKEREKLKKDSSRQATTPPLPTSSVIQFVSEHNHSFSSGSTTDDQEPTSTVSIATPPQDPYIRYADADSPTMSGNVSTSGIWSGNINMVDVATFQIVLQAVVGNSQNLGALLPEELDVVGRIGPDTVWEYISKIKRSPNKEIVIIRLIPATESETAAYKVLFQYLENRNRLGVINTVSPQIKDFYIYPLGAGKTMPSVLLPAEKIEFYEDPYRPDILVGVLVRIIGKRHSAVQIISTSSSNSKSYRRGTDTDSFTPPGSPKRKRRMHASTPKVDEIDVDAIIKAPITTKSHKASTIPSTAATDDADEPYSPGGSSEDDTPITSKMAARSDDDDLKRKMEELNRQIAAQEKEIAGLLNVESTCFATTSSSKTSAVLANISIPSNLSQILASIKGKPEAGQMQFSTTSIKSQSSVTHATTKTRSNSVEDEEYNPELVSFEKSTKPTAKSTSRLAQLSEAELLSMVPDDMIDTPPAQKSLPSCTEIKTHFEEPPPPGV
ncbi:uncharacterized protein LOC129240074 isoform X1 [Anastrepha obliqua]|uniref:uncharacterized protein LOC129240074 isoform X1 n=1 Tax=Anastrepha obliqua TaxID=95512 RepID=UPI00240A9280|nr:uncharacterized protein LOC129240074 isoform X1 [Anastrepha obliqua]XP_054731533.1 uncharacterized protein LOC129240074 isoform X1 [Anastrepha obliqua]